MEHYIVSRRGTREINEDCAKMIETSRGFCCILADGLGGHDRGEVASRLVTENSLKIYESECSGSTVDLEGVLNRCFRESQDELLSLQKKAGSEMKTTMVALASAEGRLQWGHIGDSRLYYFNNGKLVLRTLDHSVPQMLVRTGEIKEKDIRGHEDRNQLLRVMGTRWDSPKYEIAKSVAQTGSQAFLLCSDGFWEWIEEKQMVRALNRSNSPKEWLSIMEAEILNRAQGKEMDNFSAIGVFLGGPVKKKRIFGFI